MPSARLAKLTPPRLHGAIARARLFVQLDKLRAQRAIWISGPPGSGKTTLAASYLQAARATSIWYLLDSGDSDPASFFYYLTHAVAGVSRKRGPRLPLLTTEYLADLEGFSHRFFRDAFARLPKGVCVVLDNYHEIAPESALHRMLSGALSEIPHDGNLIVISRLPPPAVFARFQISGDLGLLGWEELRLEPHETKAIVATRQTPHYADVQAIHDRAGGWVAGVRLLLEGLSGSANAGISQPPDELEAAFDYFAAEIFDAASADTQAILLRTAFFPRFTAEMACRISDSPQAGQLAEQMYKRRLFVDRRVAGTVTYQYHDLFRTFLQNRALSTLSRNDLTSLAADSARLLSEAGLIGDAFGLFIQASDWEQAERVFLDQAQQLIAQGRWQTLAEWAGMFPPHRLQSNPWLQYWLGRSTALVDATKALPMLETAYDLFQIGNDGGGRILCAATVIETLHFVVAHWDTMDRWLERLKHDVESCNVELRTDDWLRIHAALFWAAENSFNLSDPVISSSVEKTAELLSSCTDVNLRVSVANMLHYHTARCLDARISAIATREGRLALTSGDLSADRHALYYLSEGLAHMDFARFAQALECIDRADEIIAANGLPGRDHIAGVWRSLIHYAAGDLASAEQSLARTESLRTADLHVIAQVLENARSWIAFGGGQTGRALERNAAAIGISETKGPYLTLAVLLPNRAYMLIASDQIEAARPVLTRIREESAIMDFESVGASVELLEAWADLRSGRHDECRTALLESLLQSRDERHRLRMRWYPRATADLIPLALEENIEPGIARLIVKEHGVAPPPGIAEAWPWKIRIQTMGSFQILVDDKPLAFGRKVPKRTLALLKAIVALGSKDIPEEKLADALWPDLEGDAAMDSLAAALHRLRRLLGSNESVRQSGGKLSLGEQRCFVDARAFELLAESENPDRKGAALALYRGPFLHGEPDVPWAAPRRERLRGIFIRTVQALGRDCESHAAYDLGVRHYAQGIQADELFEPFYQGLMRCYIKLGMAGEARTTFQRLQRELASSLGAVPSPESHLLLEQLDIRQPVTHRQLDSA